MSTLLLRLAAPLQSWGAESKFDRRNTERAPTKSGVIGLAACALGRLCSDSVEDLAGLRFGVRVDRAGILLRDFHTARAEGAKNPYVTHRYYLSDAVFLAGLEGDRSLLESIEAAIARPAFPLYLGRRSCPPEGRIVIGINEFSLEDGLKSHPWLAPSREKDVKLRIFLEAGNFGSAHFMRDEPLSFDRAHKRYGFRRITEYTVNPVVSEDRGGRESETSHDPMRELEG